MKNIEKFFLFVAIIGFIAFFLPWLGLDVGGSRYSASPSLSGFDIVKLGDSFKKNFGASSHLMTIFVLLTFPIAFLLSLLARLRVFEIPLKVVKFIEFIPFVAMIFVVYKISSLTSEVIDSQTMLEVFSKILKIGFYITVFSSILILIAPFYPNDTNNKESKKGDQNKQNTTLNSEIPKKKNINIQEKISSLITNLVNFCKNNIKIILISIAIIVAVFFGNKVIQNIQEQQRQEQMRELERQKQEEIQNKAQTLATNLCECYSQRETDTEKKLTEFSKAFEEKQYKKPSQAQKEISSLLESAEKEKDSCIERVESQKLSFSSNSDFKHEITFEELFDENKSSCIKNYDPINSDTYKNIIQKIEAIKIPEPTLDTIKANLIGKEIIVWKFKYLSEFKNTKIDTTEKYNDDTTLKYTIQTGLQSEKANYDTVLFVYYKKDGEDWIFEDVKMQSVSVVHVIPTPDNWRIIKFLNGYKLSYDDDKKLRWLYNLNIFKKGLDTGPDVTNSQANFQKECGRMDMCHVQSREGKEIQVKFTYTLME